MAPLHVAAPGPVGQFTMVAPVGLGGQRDAKQQDADGKGELHPQTEGLHLSSLPSRGYLVTC